jgi:hypothetical protein
VTIIITINLGNWFESPVEDIRDFLDVTIDETDAIQFSEGYDFTLNGLFPTFTEINDWEQLASLEYEFDLITGGTDEVSDGEW